MRQLKIATTFTDRNDLTLDKYLSDVSRESMITQDEEVELTKRIKRGDALALDKMVRANLRFVVSVAKQYQGQGMPLIDMISEGNVGLIKAAEKFDETRGFKFISYAVWWIRQSIMAAISEHSRTVRLPLSQTSNIYKIRRAASSLEQKFEREPTTLELAELLEFTEECVTTSTRNAHKGLSIDKPLSDSEDFCLADTLSSTNGNETDRDMMNSSLAVELERSLSRLGEMERDILSMNFGLGKHDEMSLTAIALELDLSKERVRQIKQRALKTLSKNVRTDMKAYLE
jgi:RNA polymerase primary sigma factor